MGLGGIMVRTWSGPRGSSHKNPLMSALAYSGYLRIPGSIRKGLHMAEALYRKYRPQVFEDMVGQDHIERTIKNAIGQDKVSHAYLFCGPRGTGKTTTARLLAKALLCKKGPTAEPDGTCENCLEVAKGDHPDVYELDAASRTGVENVREEIIGRVQFAPTQGRYKVYIIDEVHMLSTAAFNALLKTLEEPPSHVVFILCTTDPQKVPETIHSRCQRFDFHRIAPEAIVSRLGAICVAEDVEFEGDALDLIAYRAEGGMRNALTSLEQLIAFGEGKVTLALAERMLGSLESNDMAEIVTAIGQRDIAKCFAWTDAYVDTGSDLAQFVRDLAQHIRNMYVLSLAGNEVPLEVSETIRRELINEMQYFGQDRLSRLLGVLGDVSAELKTSSNPRLSFEIALTRMIRPDSDVTLESLAERVEALESGYSAVSHVISAPGGTVGSVAAPQPAPTAQEGLPAEEPYTKEPPATTAEAAPVTASADQAAGQTLAAAADHMPSSASQSESLSTAQTTPESQTQSTTPATDWTNPAVLQRTWQSVMTGIKKQKAAHGALFLNTRASYDEAQRELIVEFPNSFSYSAVQKPEIMELVKTLLEQAAGKPINFQFVQRSAEAKEAVQPEVNVAAQPTPTFTAPVVSGAPQPQVDHEEVPLDAYESTVPAQDAAMPATAEPVQSFTTQDNKPDQQADSAPAGQPLPTASNEAAQTMPTAGDASGQNMNSNEDLDAILTLGFGEGVVLEEVDNT